MGAMVGEVQGLMGLLPQRGRPACASCGDKADAVCARCQRPVCQLCDARPPAGAPSKRGGARAKGAICLPCAIAAGELDGAAMAIKKRVAETDHLTGRSKSKAPEYKSKGLLPTAHAGLLQLACLEAGVPDGGMARFSRLIDTARPALISDIALSHKASREGKTLRVDKMVACLDQYYDEIIGSLRGVPAGGAGGGKTAAGSASRATIALENELRLTKLSRYFDYHGLEDPSRVLQGIIATASLSADEAFGSGPRTGPIQLLGSIRRAYGKGMEYDDYDVSTFQGTPSRSAKRQRTEEGPPLLGRLIIAETWMGFAGAQAALVHEMPRRLKEAMMTDAVRLGKAVLRTVGDIYRPGDEARRPLEAIPKTIDTMVEQVKAADAAAHGDAPIQGAILSIRGIGNLESLPLLFQSGLGEGSDEAHLMEACDQWMALLLGQLHDCLDAMGRGVQQAQGAEGQAAQLLRIVGELDGRYLTLIDKLRARPGIDRGSLVSIHRQFWVLATSMIRMTLLKRIDRTASDAIGSNALDQVEALADLRRKLGIASTPATDMWMGDHFAPPRVAGPTIVPPLRPRPEQPRPEQPRPERPWEEVIEEAAAVLSPVMVEVPPVPLPAGPMPDQLGQWPGGGVVSAPLTVTTDDGPILPPAAPPMELHEDITTGMDMTIPPPVGAEGLAGFPQVEPLTEQIEGGAPEDTTVVEAVPPPPEERPTRPEDILKAMGRPPRVVAGAHPVSEGAMGIFLPGTEAAFNALKDGLGSSVQLSEGHLSEEPVELPGLGGARPMREAVRSLVAALIMAKGMDKAEPLEVVAFVSLPDPTGDGDALCIVTDPWIVAEERDVRDLVGRWPQGQGIAKAMHGALGSRQGPMVLMDARGAYLKDWTWGLFRELHMLAAGAGEPRAMCLVQVAGNPAFLWQLATEEGTNRLLGAMAHQEGGG